ncbi:MAG: ATP-binding protein [Bacteroidetes bacterium]|nr:ATP-binding protein [Bacteroidota bacterium]
MKKIVIIGPESTGKSTLCEQLAAHYNTLWCPEYAREYLLKHGTNYSFEDLLTIAKGQLALEEKYIESVLSIRESEIKINGLQNADSRFRTQDSLLFIDTDMYVMKVWCEFVFGSCHRFILDQIVERKYDLYLLCNVDLPWVKDELREYPDLETRSRLYLIYKDILINQSVPWVDVSGNYDERLRKAIIATDKLITTL